MNRPVSSAGKSNRFVSGRSDVRSVDGAPYITRLPRQSALSLKAFLIAAVVSLVLWGLIVWVLYEVVEVILR